MVNGNQISRKITVFQGRHTPGGAGRLVGYGALLDAFGLQTPLPSRLAIISDRHHRYEESAWSVFTPRHQPADTLAGHLAFALRYEGVDLGILKALFRTVTAAEIAACIRQKPTGRYSRRIWFLYEWLLQKQLDIPDARAGNFVDVLDARLQFPGPSESSKRHRVRNNLPGVYSFCPLVRRTPTLTRFGQLNLSGAAQRAVGSIHKDVLARAASFLLLQDSRASFAIEGERPPLSRIERWGRVLAQAGRQPLDWDEFIRLQQIVIGDHRFTPLGWRAEGGFVGVHDRATGLPIPEHISARWQDIHELMEGLIATEHRLHSGGFDPVIAAAMIAFGFVFIHPFADGNGRIHRYLIHHTLAAHGFTPPGLVFPVSAVIMERIEEYRQALEAFSRPRLEFIRWRPTSRGNLEVLNDTADLYRYFDATPPAEFLYDCVRQTIEQSLPAEADYLERYDRMKAFVDHYIDMPDRMVDLLIRFLRQNKGKLSNRARTKEFSALTPEECRTLEERYAEIFSHGPDSEKI